MPALAAAHVECRLRLLFFCVFVPQDHATLQKLLPTLLQQQSQGQQRFKFVTVLWDDAPHAASSNGSGSSGNGNGNGKAAWDHTAAVSQLSELGVKVLAYDAVLAAGSQLRGVGPFQPAACSRSSLATLVYTSGTTGECKLSRA